MFAGGFSLEYEGEQVSSGLQDLLSVLADLSNAAVGIVSTLPPISNSSGPLSRFLETVMNVSTTIAITLTLIFHSF